MKDAFNYNRQIINNASNHLESMRSALAAANYKLQIIPPEDVIIGEKSFASRFVLEALNELYGVTDGIENEILEIEDVSKIVNVNYVIFIFVKKIDKKKSLLKKNVFRFIEFLYYHLF